MACKTIEKTPATALAIKLMKAMTWVSLMKRTKLGQIQTPAPSAANVPIIFVAARNGFKNDTAVDEFYANPDAPSH